MVIVKIIIAIQQKYSYLITYICFWFYMTLFYTFLENSRTYSYYVHKTLVLKCYYEFPSFEGKTIYIYHYKQTQLYKTKITTSVKK